MTTALNSSLTITLTMVTLTLTWCGGCSRAVYRKTADRQVESILQNRMNDPRWNLPRTDIQTSPRSRFHNLNDPDCPPLPPGDITADQIMFHPWRFRGAKLWRNLPNSESVENPFFSADGWINGENDLAVKQIENLSLAEAVELSLVNSREYQQQLENLYLAALNLTFERYRFQVRPLGLDGLEPSSGFGYRQGPNGASNFELGPTFFGLSRLFPSGAQFIGELVNDTIWLFSGPNSTASATSIAFSLVQPLMRGAGREIVLEDLTQAERNVLYAIRGFARFRKQFFVNTITGGQVAGLQRFLRGFEFLGGSGSPSIGFFPVLLRLQQLRNRQYITRTLEYLIDDLKAADADALDIARLESTLADTRGDLYADQRVFEDNRDQYKVQLGLPPDLPVSLDDTLLEPFEFVDPTLIDLEDRLRRLAAALRNPNADQDKLRKEFEKMAADANQTILLVGKDIARLDKILPNNLSQLDQADAAQLKRIIAEEKARFANVKTEVAKLESAIKQIKQFAPDPDVRDDQGKVVPAEAEKLRLQLLVVLRRLSVIQTIMRVELIPLQPFEIDIVEGVSQALVNRLDLMNRRARVTDARRNLELAADQLEANVEVVGDATVSTKPLLNNNKPFDFRAKQSTFGVGLRFDTPLDRVAERNDFRAAQIAYEQAKRGFMAAEDNVKLQVRQAVRTLKQLNQTLVQRRRRVQFSARELDLAESMTETSQRGLALNNALRTINRAQDELIEVWLDYETTRLNLYRDIGSMEIDERGFWRDPVYQQMADQYDEK